MATAHGDALLDDDPLAEFGLDRVVEELETLERLATEAGVPYDLLGQTADLHREALAAYGAIDGELLGPRLLLDRAGVARLRVAADDRLDSSATDHL